jgi:two-component system, LytTR family, sensor kinase
MNISIKRRLKFVGWLLGLWTTAAILFALQGYTYDSLHGHTWPIFEYFRWALEEWYTWALFSPLVLWLATKRPIEPRRLSRSLPLHLAASTLIAVLAVCVQAVLSHFFNTDRGPVLGYIRLYLSKDVALNIATYWALVGCAQTLAFHRENSDRRLREGQLEKQLAQAHLQVLQMQLHPHFLFNTLHAVATLIREDPDAAEQMLLDLGSLLRMFLEQNSSRQISLRRELSLVDRYLNIQRVRFRDRLTIRSCINPDTLDCSIPCLILQPIVENAILHGIAKNPGSDSIEIKSWRHETQLQIEISNSNSILPDDVGPDGAGWGIGLSNTQQRLTQIYSGVAKLSIQARSPRGVICCITVPFERGASESSETEALLSL